MPTFKVPVIWSLVGEFEVEANSLDEAIEKVENNENDAYPLDKAHGEYIDDSLIVNLDCAKEANTVGDCKHCGAALYLDRGVLTDRTGGDVCGHNGGNEPHEMQEQED